MGLTNNDNYVCSNGVQKTGTYISFANETLYLRQAFNGQSTQATYTMNANYRVFWDEASRDKNMSFIDLKSVSVNVSKDMLGSNMYECLYEELKKIYPNTTDTLRGVATFPPAAPVPAPAPAEPVPSVPAPAPAPAPTEPVPSVPAPSEPVAPAPSVPAPSDPAPAPSEPVPSNP
jgi:hypothetical protein